MRSTISVLIPYFNEGRLIHECLDSLLSQSEWPDEILIYDDASEMPADNFIPPNPKIQVFRGDSTQGPAHSRNVLLGKSQNDYIHFHDSDDLFHPAWLSRVRNTLQKTEADLVLTEVSSYQEGRLVSERLLGIHHLAVEKNLVRFCLQGAVLPIASTLRRELALRLGGYSETLPQSEDFYFHARLALHVAQWAIIDEPLVIKRNRPDSHSRDVKEVWQSTLEAVKLLEREIPSFCRADLADAAARTGSHLFQIEAYSEAKQAFYLAQRIGSPQYRGQKSLYKAIAKTFGPETAEYSGMLYRNLIPEKIRHLLGRM